LSRDRKPMLYANFVRIFPNTSANSGPLKPLIGIVWLGC
jgi:hypothetical protein